MGNANAPSTWLLVGFFAIRASAANSFQPQIPKTWDDAQMRSVEIPLAHPAYSPRHASADFYYRMPVRTMYQSYPVYRPDREPPGYLQWLEQREPRLIWDAAKLRTREDWIRAGEAVFEAPISYGGIGVGPGHSDQLYVRKPSWHERVRPPITSDGVLPFVRYVVRTKGKVEIGVLACAMCHTRALRNGSVLKAAPGTFPLMRHLRNR